MAGCLMMNSVYFFNPCQELVEEHGQNTQDNDAHHDPVQFENLAAIDDQITETGIGGEEFTDDDTYQAQTDIDFHIADDGRDTGRKDNIAHSVFPGAAEGADQQQFISIYMRKGSVQVDDRAENGQ